MKHLPSDTNKNVIKTSMVFVYFVFMAAGAIHNTFMVVLWSFCTSADVTADLNSPTDMNSHGHIR